MSARDDPAHPVSAWRILKPVLILPGTVLVAVPALLLGATGGPHAPAWPAVAAGLASGAAGLCLAGWTMRLFVARGRGTPAPWDPPRRLVVTGPYAHVRNPMISAVLMILLAEALLSASWPLAAWMALIWAANMIYFPLVEEPGLEARFGEDYRLYRRNVPRWLPRLTPWKPPAGNGGPGVRTA